MSIGWLIWKLFVFRQTLGGPEQHRQWSSYHQDSKDTDAEPGEWIFHLLVNWPSLKCKCICSTRWGSRQEIAWRRLSRTFRLLFNEKLKKEINSTPFCLPRMERMGGWPWNVCLAGGNDKYEDPRYKWNTSQTNTNENDDTKYCSGRRIPWRTSQWGWTTTLCWLDKTIFRFLDF